MVNGSLKLITLSGIPVYIHWSFSLIILVALNVGYTMDLDWQGTASVLLFFLVVFVCVVLHEMGHALAARRYGIRTQDIILTPIGGIARMEGLPEKPIREIIIALAGPLVNIIIALFLWIILTFVTKRGVLLDENPIGSSLIFSNFLPLLFNTNFVLAIFNLLPAFPLDGGRVFRALLAMRWNRERATYYASRVGQLAAVAFFAFGLYEQEYTLMLIGVFVYFAAGSEYKTIKNDDVLEHYKISEISWSNFRLLYETDNMAKALAYLTKGHETNFLVADDQGKIVGFLSEEIIIDAANANVDNDLISHHMKPIMYRIKNDDSLRNAYRVMQAQHLPILPILEDGFLVGVLDADAIDHFLSLRQQLKK
ncbi:MAG: site-2 protease family protein [Saprospiraceae bacterium]|nr:site-2 protease family protein [Saprospiraceae bacterium]